MFQSGGCSSVQCLLFVAAVQVRHRTFEFAARQRHREYGQDADEQRQLNQSLEKELTKTQASLEDSLRLAATVAAAPDSARPKDA